ncbi:serine/threonine protein phosphatase [Aspergillus heteromorphus CBS 117.55]|uniref:Protein phosphatase n=1 Tax=Aspergillus heteromorphus CBS 117.55 TaxID=1448321 RepID=A0A317WU42_9EURO|nr:serine/threonine protein phosphatase [Aspergillus heteromorphus CBS 117.55]PWY89341.1 serine/threonine protein phosphatase [Aspergillus heteromorphus CBS 117.55]
MIALVSSGRACSSACSSLHTVVRDGFLASLLAPRSSGLRHPSTSSSFPAPRSPRFTPRRPFHSTSPLNSTTTKVSYGVAASSSGKGRRFYPIKNSYNFTPEEQEAIGVVTDTRDRLIQRRRRPDSGEDAFFASRVGQNGTNAVAFAVADGVGGWAESKVDPADFSHALCGYMAEAALSWDSPAEELRPVNLLQAGYDGVVADDKIPAGGSTASVGVGLEDGRVELANLGDSGSVLLRLGAVHHYSIPQTHGFNTPYQLSIIPPQMRTQASIFGGSFLEDFPRDAAVTNLQMQHGDVLILATDGVFDNLNNQDILKHVTSRMIATGAWTVDSDYGIQLAEGLKQLTQPEGLSSLIFPSQAGPEQSSLSRSREHSHTLQSLIAASIVGEAKLASMDSRRDGPFAKEAQRYYPGDWYRGGKVDDISVVVVVAVDEGYPAKI